MTLLSDTAHGSDVDVGHYGHVAHPPERQDGCEVRDQSTVETVVPAGERIAAELVSARQRAFVGRTSELAAFRAALAKRDSTVVWHVHGPGGIGKSTLLRRLADEARAADQAVFEADLSALATPGALVAACQAILRQRPAVVVLDNAESGPEDLGVRLARLLPQPATILLCSRVAPVRFPGVRAVRLGPWSPDEAREFLLRRGVPAPVQGSLLAFAGGHPAALSLAAIAALRDGMNDAWAPGPAVTAELRDRLVGAPPTPAHRLALDVCAHAPAVTEDLLQAVTGPQAAELYSWLRRQPFVEITPIGLQADDVVRATLDADLRWGDPAGYQRLHEQLTGHLLRATQTARRPGEGSRAARALCRLVLPDGRAGAGLRAGPIRGHDRAEVLALAAAEEGPATAALVSYWLDRQPLGFRVHRPIGADRIAAFDAVLSLPTVPDDALDADPVVAAAAAHVGRMPSRPGEQWLLQRFAVPAAGDDPDGLARRLHEHSFTLYLTTKRLAWSFVAVAEHVDLSQLMTLLDHRPIAPDPVSGHRIYAHDWRAVPLRTWLDRVNAGRLYGAGAITAAPEREVVVLGADEFGAAVRDLLRGWHRPATAARSPLLRTRLVTTAAADGDPIERLRSVLGDAVSTLSAEPRGVPLFTALTATYFAGVGTQAAVAKHLQLPYGTYRRHLARGIDRVIDILWEREAGSDDVR